jgi:hypothetical protein
MRQGRRPPVFLFAGGLLYDLAMISHGGPAPMRIVFLAAASLLLLGLSLSPQPAYADCAAVRAACIDHCRGEVDATRAQACANRCSIAFCQDVPTTCRPGDQRVCNDGFRSCNGVCDALASIPTAAAAVNANACANKCCSQFKACLNQRSCDTSSIGSTFR